MTERKEPLGNGVYVLVTDEHHFSTDTILLANFAQPRKHERAVELGSGCGTISLIWARDGLPLHTKAVEIQQNACDLMVRSIQMNKLDDKIEVINADLRNLKGFVPFAENDLVVCNPPYKISGGGIVNPNESHKLARHECTCTNDDVIEAAAALLRFGGRFCLCQRPERLADIIMSMRKHGIEPKRLRFVQQRLSKAPKLFLIEGKKGANPGGLNVLNTLFIEDESGDFSQEMRDIYGIYKESAERNRELKA